MKFKPLFDYLRLVLIATAILIIADIMFFLFFPTATAGVITVVSVMIYFWVIALWKKKNPEVGKRRVERIIDRENEEKRAKFGECPKCGAPKENEVIKFCRYCQYNFTHPK